MNNYYKFIKMNKSLKELIISNIPSACTSIEKAIYIYIRMCKLFTYDDEFYALHQNFDSIHRNINYIENISFDNNKIVCYEFNTIYAYLLNELNIDVQIISNNKNNKYGDGHVYLYFYCEGYLISADSVTSILGGDFFQAKLNQPLRGLKCINNKKESSFNVILEKVYKLVSNNKLVNYYESYEEIVKDKNSFYDKIKIYLEKVNSKGLTGIDFYSYLIQLYNIIFNENEKKDIGISIICSKIKEGASTSSILYIKIDNNYKYYFIDDKKITSISKEELDYNFSNNLFCYIESNHPKIPNINNKKKIYK